MRRVYNTWDRLDVLLSRWLVRHSIALLRIGLGGIFLWFGLLKFFPGISPIESLARRTMEVLTFGTIQGHRAMVVIAALECFIGLCFVTGRFLRVGVWLLAGQMLGAMSPLLLFPGELFSGPFNAPSLAGQYVIKDVVLIGAGLVIAATWSGGHLVIGRKGMKRVLRAVPLESERDDAAEPAFSARAGVVRRTGTG